MFSRKEQRRQVKRIQLNHEKHEKHESNTENEQVKIQVSACLRGMQSCTDSCFCFFRVVLFSCLSWLEMDFFVSLCLCAR